MGGRQGSRDGPPAKDDGLPSIASPPHQPLALDDDNADAHTIYSLNTQFFARARSIHPGRRGDDETLNSVRSLYDSDVLYYDIHGRRYCKEYCMPNDEEEQRRMQMLNGIYYTLLGQRLTTVPLANPKKILDIGTGTGEWAMAMGEEYLDAEIIGTDIAKIQPTSAPPNVFFEVDDAEEEGGWAWGNDEFDLIHFRYLGGAFTSWDHVYQEAYNHIKPGGWIEVLDFDDHSPFMEYLSAHTSFPAWISAFMEGCRRSGRPRGVLHMEPERLEALGFVDVKSTAIEIPVGAWVEGEEVQNGQHFLVAVLLGMEAVCLRPLTEHMGWTAEAVRETCENVAQELWKVALDPVKSQGFCFILKILAARKPDNSETVVSQDTDACRPTTGDASTVSTTGESSASGEKLTEGSASGDEA